MTMKTRSVEPWERRGKWRTLESMERTHSQRELVQLSYTVLGYKGEDGKVV